METTKSDRTVYFDYLRVFSTFAMMILHISVQNWYVTDVNSFEWQVFNFFDSIVRWSVPVFVMISGSLFLNREIPLSKIYSKYIFRLIVSFVVWSVIYSMFDDGSITLKISSVIQGHYHMWFIPMIIGLYICIPFIKAIVKNEFRIKYFLLLALIFSFVIPEIMTLASDFGNELIIKIANAINSSINNMNVKIVLGYTGYFILGYSLNKISITKKQQTIIYILGLLGFVCTIGLDLLVALKTQTSCSNYYDNFTVNVLLEAMAVFTWFKYKRYDYERINNIMQRLSKYSFGAYLIHALIIEQLNIRIGLNTLSFNPVLAVISISTLVFVVSFLISSILNHISVIKKYMV